jgi:hypothetical protein
VWDPVLSAVDVHAAEIGGARNLTDFGDERWPLMLMNFGPTKWAEELKDEDVEIIVTLFVVVLWIVDVSKWKDKDELLFYREWRSGLTMVSMGGLTNHKLIRWAIGSWPRLTQRNVGVPESFRVQVVQSSLFLFFFFFSFFLFFFYAKV